MRFEGKDIFEPEEKAFILPFADVGFGVIIRQFALTASRLVCSRAWALARISRLLPRVVTSKAARPMRWRDYYPVMVRWSLPA
jgi:hypothetical protein